MQRKLRDDTGFGLVEMLVALIILSAGLLALATALTSGSVAIRRASRVGTASALADQQLELYRSLTYSAIALDSSAVAATDSTYHSDPAIPGGIASETTITCTGLPNSCNPSRSVTGPDHGNYRIDTYIVAKTPTGGRAGKLVTVVVRDAGNLGGAPWIRESSTFDPLTG